MLRIISIAVAAIVAIGAFATRAAMAVEMVVMDRYTIIGNKYPNGFPSPLELFPFTGMENGQVRIRNESSGFERSTEKTIDYPRFVDKNLPDDPFTIHSPYSASVSDAEWGAVADIESVPVFSEPVNVEPGRLLIFGKEKATFDQIDFIFRDLGTPGFFFYTDDPYVNFDDICKEVVASEIFCDRDNKESVLSISIRFVDPIKYFSTDTPIAFTDVKIFSPTAVVPLPFSAITLASAVAFLGAVSARRRSV